MRRIGATTVLLLVSVLLPTAAPVARQAAAPAPGQGAAPGPPAPARAIVDRYCVTCHNGRMMTGGIALDALDVSRPERDPEIWERVVRKLETRTMPPRGARRPGDAEYRDLTTWLVTALDAHAAANPRAGRPMMRRLNRAEYANAIRDLLALDVDATALLPPDDSAYGFDTVGDVLGVSPSLQERYLAAAAKIASWAVGDTMRGPVEHTYRVRQDLSQNQHIDGLPPGTIGGLGVRHFFPLDGEYVMQVRLQHTNFGNLRGLDYPHEVEILVDGRRVHGAAIGGAADLERMFAAPQKAGEEIEARLVTRVRVPAGPRTVAAAFVRNLGLGQTRRLQPFLRSSANTLDWTGLPHIQSLTITGPFDPTGVGDTPSRRRIFECRPGGADAERPCAGRILRTIARRAYRQPVTGEDVQPLLSLYEEGRRQGTFEDGVRYALQAVLASPRFIFRPEHDPDGAAPLAAYPLADLDLASRLSFFLWSSIPDDELLEVAARGTLHRDDVLERQVRRMLADPRSFALVSNFAGQWLQLRNVRSVLPNTDEFPDFDDNLRQAFLRETELLFESVIREDRSVLDLLRADYTYVNERLARHYGIPDVYGSRFRRVPVPGDQRRGLLGHGSILALTSHAERTSPVVRGKWILENLLGTPPPPPPPDVPALPEVPAGRKPQTMRELLTVHRASPACASCHALMDPIGFALENFDAVGAWRTSEAGGPIDPSAELSDGTHVNGVAALRDALLRRPEVFVSTMTEKMLTYGVGRGLDHADMPAVRGIVRAAAKDDYRFSSLVLGVVGSVPFRMRDADGAAR